MFNKIVLCFALYLFINCNAFAAGKDINSMADDACAKFQKLIKETNFDFKTVSIYEITSQSKDLDVNLLKDKLTTKLVETGKYEVIDRNSLEVVLNEHKLTMSGMLDDKKMIEIGKIAGVNGFFFGSANIQGDKLTLSLKLIRVETSAIVWTKNVEGESSSWKKIGIGIYFNTMNFSPGSITVGITPDPVVAGVGPITYTNEDRYNLCTGFNFMYKQPFANTNKIQFGVNGSIGFMPVITGGATEDTGVGPLKTGYLATSGTRITFSPVFMISLSRLLFKSDKDVLLLHLEPEVAFYQLSTYINGYIVGYEDEDSYGLVYLIPNVGVDINLTSQLTLFAGVRYVPAFAYEQNLSVPTIPNDTINGLVNYDVNFSINGQFTLLMSLNYFFSL